MAYLDGRETPKPIQTYGRVVLENDLYANKKWVGQLGPGSQKPKLTINRTSDTVTQVHETIKPMTREGSYPNNIIGNMPGFNDDLTLHYQPIQAGITGLPAEFDKEPYVGYGGTFLGSMYMYGGLENAFEFVNGKYQPKVLHQHSASMPEWGGARADSLVNMGLLPPIQDKPWYSKIIF